MTSKHLAALAAVAALAAPTAALADGGHGHSGESHGKAGQHGHGQAKAKNAVFKGTVVSDDASAGTVVVHVLKANHWGRSLQGSDVTFTVTQDLSAVKAGDPVLVQARVAKDSAQPFAARKFVDQAADEQGSSDDQQAGDGGQDS